MSGQSTKILYRTVGVTYAVSGTSTNHVELLTLELPVVSRTPKGWWVVNSGHRRFVLADARKKYACTTEKEAIQSFAARKRRQIKIINAQLKVAKEFLALAEAKLAESNVGAARYRLPVEE